MWVGSFEGYHINRKYSHFNKRLEKLVRTILSKIQENFLQRVRLWNKSTSVFLYSSLEITKVIFCNLYFQSFNSFFNLLESYLSIFVKKQFSGPVVFSIKRPHFTRIKFNSGHSFKRLHPKRYNPLFFNLMQQL